MRSTILPIICSCERHPTVELRESTETARLSPNTNHESAGTRQGRAISVVPESCVRPPVSSSACPFTSRTPSSLTSTTSPADAAMRLTRIRSSKENAAISPTSHGSARSARSTSPSRSVGAMDDPCTFSTGAISAEATAAAPMTTSAASVRHSALLNRLRLRTRSSSL